MLYLIYIYYTMKKWGPSIQKKYNEAHLDLKFINEYKDYDHESLDKYLWLLIANNFDKTINWTNWTITKETMEEKLENKEYAWLAQDLFDVFTELTSTNVNTDKVRSGLHVMEDGINTIEHWINNNIPITTQESMLIERFFIPKLESIIKKETGNDSFSETYNMVFQEDKKKIRTGLSYIGTEMFTDTWDLVFDSKPATEDEIKFIEHTILPKLKEFIKWVEETTNNEEVNLNNVRHGLKSMEEGINTIEYWLNNKTMTPQENILIKRFFIPKLKSIIGKMEGKDNFSENQKNFIWQQKNNISKQLRYIGVELYEWWNLAFDSKQATEDEIKFIEQTILPKLNELISKA